jgi:hypothetical protein
MQLRTARLCLDCDHVHETQQCPVCASEALAFMTRLGLPPERPLYRLRPSALRTC